MNFLLLLLLLPFGLASQEGAVLIHTVPSLRPRWGAAIQKSRAEQDIEQLGLDSSTRGLIELLEQPVADRDWNRKWHKIYAARALAGRNAKEAIPALSALADDSYLSLRIEAAIALAHLDPQRGKVVLTQFLQDQSLAKKGYSRVMKVAGALADVGDASGYDVVVQGLRLEHRKTTAVILLPKFAKLGIDVLPLLLDALEEATEDLGKARRGGHLRFHWALIGLTKLGDGRALAKLQEIMERVPVEDRRLVKQTIQQIRLSDTGTLIKVLRSDADKYARRYAAWRLGEKRVEKAVPALVSALEDDELVVRLEAALALVRLGDERGRAWLKRAFRDPSLGERKDAIYVAGALAELGDASGFPLVEHILAQGSWPRRYDAVKVLPVFKRAGVDPAPHLLRALTLAGQALASPEEGTARWARETVRLGLEYVEYFRYARALPLVQELSQSDDAEVRTAAEKVLRQLGTPARRR